MTEITFICSDINSIYKENEDIKNSYCFPYVKDKTISDYMNDLRIIYDKFDKETFSFGFIGPGSSTTTTYQLNFSNFIVIDFDNDLVPLNIPLKNFRNYRFRLVVANASLDLIKELKLSIKKLLDIKFIYNFRNLQGKKTEKKMITVTIQEKYFKYIQPNVESDGIKSTTLNIPNDITFEELIILYIQKRPIQDTNVPVPSCPMYNFLESATLFNSEGIPRDLTLSEANINDNHLFCFKQRCFIIINLEYYDNILKESLEEVNKIKNKINKFINYLN